jgi:hypothetical protein
LVAAENPEEVFRSFKWIVELECLTLEKHDFECLPLGLESQFVYQITSTVVDVEVAHVIFKFLLELL